ncbi:30S ribosomal protein S19e [archaeon]|nr:30S ribosomal protein S19e [archaeon]
MGIFDVPASMLIEEVAKDLKQKIQQPDFIAFVKSGAHTERAPNNPDWFYMRNASILYQIYKHGAAGTGHLRNYYGGRKNRGVKPERKRKASGKIIRVCLQSLEKQGLLKKEKKGRIVSSQGEKLLYAKSLEVGKIFEETKKKKEQEKKERIEKVRANREKAFKEVQAKKQAQQVEAKQQTHENKPEHKPENKHGKPGHEPEQKKEEVKHERGRPEAKKA